MAKCCVRGCSNKLEVGSSIRMFRFPALLEKPKSLVELSRQRRNAWLKALNRTNLTEDVLKSIGICSEHFVTGSPARLKDNTEVDWVPTIKMGTVQRTRIEKKTTSPSQITKIKPAASTEKLSELEKLKNELKCKDELIKSYKDESVQLKNQQKKIVNNYEERLKQKDNKIRMSIRELQKESKEPQRSESHAKGTQGISMRSGRILQKQVFKQKLIKRCVVRIRRIRQIKEEQPDDDDVELPQKNFGSKSNLSKQNTSREIALRSRTSTPKDQSSQEPSPRTRSLRETASRNLTPVAGLKSNKQISGSPKQEDPEVPTKIAPKKSTETNKPKPASKKADDSIFTELCLKKVESVLLSKSKPNKAEEVQTPNQNTTKTQELRTPRPSARKVDEPASAMASTRTRRAPKPNPKYANDDVITPNINKLLKRDRNVVVINEAAIESDSADDFFYGVTNETGTETNDDRSEAFEVDESSDFSDGDFLLKRRRTPKPVSVTSRSTTPVAKRSRPERPQNPLPQAVKPTAVETKKILPVAQKMPTIQQQLLANRKRKFNETQSTTRKETPESLIVRNKRMNIALYDSNDARPASPIRGNTVKQQNIAMAQAKIPSAKAASIVLQTKRQMAGPLSSKTGAQLMAQQTKPKLKHDALLQHQLQQQQQPPKSAVSIQSSPEVADSANTQDDFETMPTFTIVNINDIIKKKGDSLVSKRPDDDLLEDSLKPNNRRKLENTTVLSTKLDASKLKPLPKSALPPMLKKQVSQSNISTQVKAQQRSSLTPTSSSSLEQRNQVNKYMSSPEKASPLENISPNKDKPAPRILNSVVGKKTFPVQPILSKPDTDLDRDQTDDLLEKSVMVKENVGANKLVPAKPTPVRKLPSEKVCVQRQGNKLIKKITCFETWYVINIPETQELIVKNILDIPLITLSNAVKTIKLPSSSWSSKVTLYKLSTQMASKSNLTPYTGDLSDQSIKEDDREKYQPSCVMFRRMTQEKSKTRMPYDRAVIFKMKTFFTNIDGKNVRLVGAPSKIGSFEDIEVLLELVDELDLLHEFVEPANTV